MVAISKLINGLSHFLASLTFKMLQIYFRVEKEVRMDKEVEKEDDEVFRDSKDLKEGRRPVYIYIFFYFLDTFYIGGYHIRVCHLVIA